MTTASNQFYVCRDCGREKAESAFGTASSGTRFETCRECVARKRKTTRRANVAASRGVAMMDIAAKAAELCTAGYTADDFSTLSRIGSAILGAD